MIAEISRLMSEGPVAFQKMDGALAIPLHQITLRDNLNSGDAVEIFSAPGDKLILYKKEGGIPIKITSAYVIFNPELKVDEG